MNFRVKLSLLEWIFIVGGGVLVFGFVGLFMSRQWKKSQRSDVAAEAFLAKCTQQQDEGQCRQLLNENHEECFFVNDVPGGKVSRGYFRGSDYEQCVSMGFEPWREARRAKRRADERERKGLGLP